MSSRLRDVREILDHHKRRLDRLENILRNPHNPRLSIPRLGNPGSLIRSPRETRNMCRRLLIASPLICVLASYIWQSIFPKPGFIGLILSNPVFLAVFIPLAIILIYLVEVNLDESLRLIVFLVSAMIFYFFAREVSRFSNAQWFTVTTAFSQHSDIFEALKVWFCSSLLLVGIGFMIFCIWLFVYAYLSEE